METTQAVESSTDNQPVEISIEDRILGAMGEAPEEEEPQEVKDDESEETPEEESQQEESGEDLEEIEIDGEVWKVPPKLKEGFLRQQDYTRKTQEVAAERQAVQEQRQAIEQERQAFQNQVQAQQQNFQLHAQVAAIDSQIAQYANVDWQQLIDSDPVEAMKLDKGLQALRESRNSLVQQAIAQQEQLSYYQQQQHAQLLEQGKAELQKRIPDWSAEKASSLRDYGAKFGFTAEEIGSIIDPRQVEVLNKAFLYDQLVASKPNVTNKVSVAPKVIKPSAQKPKQSNTEVLRKIAKTSSDKNARNSAIQRLLESKL